MYVIHVLCVSILSNDFFLLILYNVGDVYEGEYVNEKKHGKGKYTSANGDVYEGDFVEGKKCGQGVFTYSSGNVYSGEYKDGKQNGQVLLTPLLIHSFTDVPPQAHSTYQCSISGRTGYIHICFWKCLCGTI